MATYINLTTKEYPIYEGDLLVLQNNISYPIGVTPVFDGYAEVFPSPQPDYDIISQTITSGEPEKKGSQWFQTWSIEQLSPEQVKINQDRAALVARNIAKQIRQDKVDAILVTVGDKVFNGDEISQGRMARAIIGFEATGQPTLTWVLADNTAVQVTKVELVTALCLAGQEQANMWVI